MPCCGFVSWLGRGYSPGASLSRRGALNSPSIRTRSRGSGAALHAQPGPGNAKPHDDRRASQGRHIAVASFRCVTQRVPGIGHRRRGSPVVIVIYRASPRRDCHNIGTTSRMRTCDSIGLRRTCPAIGANIVASTYHFFGDGRRNNSVGAAPATLEQPRPESRPDCRGSHTEGQLITRQKRQRCSKRRRRDRRFAGTVRRYGRTFCGRLPNHTWVRGVTSLAGFDLRRSACPRLLWLGVQRLRNTDLYLQLKKHGIHKLIVIGVIAHICVEATVRYAVELGYERLDAERPCRSARQGQRTRRLPVSRARFASGHGSPSRGSSIRFRVLLDGRPPGDAHGTDVDEEGYGTATEQRLYQLIRQPKPIADRAFEIEFSNPAWRLMSLRSDEAPQARPA